MKKLKFKNQPKTSFLFDDYRWYKGFTAKEMEFICERDSLSCMCYLASNPVTNTIFFHIKNKIHD